MQGKSHLSLLTKSAGVLWRQPGVPAVFWVSVFVLGPAFLFLVNVVWTAMSPPIPMQVETRVFTPPAPPQPAVQVVPPAPAQPAAHDSEGLRSLDAAIHMHECQRMCGFPLALGVLAMMALIVGTDGIALFFVLTGVSFLALTGCLWPFIPWLFGFGG